MTKIQVLPRPEYSLTFVFLIYRNTLKIKYIAKIFERKWFVMEVLTISLSKSNSLVMVHNLTFRKNSCILLLVILASFFPTLHARDAYGIKTDFIVTETESHKVAFERATDISTEVKYWYYGDHEVAWENSLSTVNEKAGEYDSCTKNRIGISESGADCNLFADFIFDLQGNLMNAKGFSLANINARYIWNFGDGQSAEGSDIKHEFMADGEYTVCLTVIQPATSPNERDCEETV